MTAPPPVQGGSRIYCPMIGMPAIEAGRKTAETGLMCGWRKRARRKALAKYRRHWRRAHLNPFLAEDWGNDGQA